MLKFILFLVMITFETCIEFLIIRSFLFFDLWFISGVLIAVIFKLTFSFVIGKIFLIKAPLRANEKNKTKA